jgi:hypothetical protein
MYMYSNVHLRSQPYCWCSRLTSQQLTAQPSHTNFFRSALYVLWCVCVLCVCVCVCYPNRSISHIQSCDSFITVRVDALYTAFFFSSAVLLCNFHFPCTLVSRYIVSFVTSQERKSGRTSTKGLGYINAYSHRGPSLAFKVKFRNDLWRT